MPTEFRALRLTITGVVQGVGFRPFVYRLAREHGLTGWTRNNAHGVVVHVEGAAPRLAEFRRALGKPPPAARVAGLTVAKVAVVGHGAFTIEASDESTRPTVRISPDLATCDGCLAELSDPTDRRHGYPYINCTDCGPRYSIILGLPYDRPQTTMRDWPLCADCAAEYADPGNRRFHAQPVACPSCGPTFALEVGDETIHPADQAMARAARMLGDGAIVAIKGLGGYHLACDARQHDAVAELRQRKYRAEKPFALLVRDSSTASRLVEMSPAAKTLLCSTARPVVILPARVDLAGVAPASRELGLMLPYTPVHHLLFAAGAPTVLVMTSGNRAGEPIAFRDEDARARLAGLADATLVGERPIARRVDDSVVRLGASSRPDAVVLRRARGYAPSVVARLSSVDPILAVGADLKNTVTLVVGGEAMLSQHIGDLNHPAARQAHHETVADLLAMYAVDPRQITIAHDLHPELASTAGALAMPGARHRAVQHHRAHVAAVITEHEAPDEPVIGVALDGTGYGDDGTIWGGELFAGSLAGGLARAGHLRPAVLPGGDAAARWPVQAAAGFLAQLDDLPNLRLPPFCFPDRFHQASRLVERGVRAFPTTSVGRLFDTVAALLGFTGEATFEGQAAMWLEQQATASGTNACFELPFRDGELDHRPLLAAIVTARGKDEAPADIARAFHRGLARGVVSAALELCRVHRCGTVVLAGGVFQNLLLLSEIVDGLGEQAIRAWTQVHVPPNDGGISLGQAAIASID